MTWRTVLAAIAVFIATPALAAETACDSLTPGLVGGPMLPASSSTAVIRWLGNANYELDFGGKVYLFDTYYDRVSRSRPIGFAVADVTRADVIFLSHAHFDHMSDIVPVAGKPAPRWWARPSPSRRRRSWACRRRRR
jgi:glyoxylase-like metal-dependent hydrolase (beta-lactamase superfamily II)